MVRKKRKGEIGTGRRKEIREKRRKGMIRRGGWGLRGRRKESDEGDTG